MDLFKPRGAAAPRKPTDNNQQNGVVTNTPRFRNLAVCLARPSWVKKWAWLSKSLVTVSA